MHTPNLDALAARSLLLERAYVQQALCAPSRSSMLTGRRPDTTHVYDIGLYFREVGGNFTTLPQYFKLNGYTSVGVGKIFHPGKSSGDDDPVSWSEPYFHSVHTFGSNDFSWAAIPDDLLVNQSLVDQQIANQAIKTLQRLAPEARSGEQPFFLAVGFKKPHIPFVFPESFLQYYPSVNLPDNQYAPVDMPPIAWHKYGGIRKFQDIDVTGEINTTLPSEKVIELRRAYYSAVSYIDSLVGKVLTELENLGLSNNTIVSFPSDHGFQLGEHGEWLKQTNFELATHAPMMVHIPGLTDGGVRTSQLAEFVDLFPTLVEAAGLEQLPLCPLNSTDVQLCREGSSLIPLISRPDKPIKKAAFSQYPRNEKNPDKIKDNRPIMGYSMRTPRYRYTEWPQFTYGSEYKPQWETRLAGVELYDHKIDNEENVNRANHPEYANVRAKLSKMLRAGWRKAQK